MEHLRLRELLKEKNMTGKQLAEEVGVSTVSMSNIVSGNSFPRPDVLRKIAKALDVELRDLFTPEGEAQALYIKKGETYIKVGELNPNSLK
ncbi:MAG: helix-turn-helix transcriptional regulator [Zunongwangia sp.]|uniref:helix-turn-helix domain-containing protein n=1 Tax=Zunongwangia sp. TaxID=1965325 RepID=UPI003242C78C